MDTDNNTSSQDKASGGSPQAYASYTISPAAIENSAQYVPVEIVTGGGPLVVPGGSFYEFGILASTVHALWMKAARQRALEKHQDASAEQIYNTFPWPEPSAEQRSAVEDGARAILAARANFPEVPLTELYAPQTMPEELRHAQEQNERAVLAAYGIDPAVANPGVIMQHLGMMHAARMQKAH